MKKTRPEEVKEKNGCEAAQGDSQQPASSAPRPSPLPGFTLIELLVVMAIIAILAGLILQTAGYVQRKGATSRAEAEVAALSAALESYKADMGDYPRSADFPNTNLAAESLYGALSPASGKVYFEFNKGMTGASGIIDPFGTAYYYEYPGNSNRSGTNFFDLYSIAGTTANETNMPRWIKNW